MSSVQYDLFISYARRDDADGWVSGLRDAVYEDFRTFSSEPFRIFFDTNEIHSRADWELRLREGLRSARVLLVCVSPNFLKSDYCRWEWQEFARMQARRLGGGDAVTGVYFVELGGDQDYDADVVAWRHDVERVQFEQLQPWFPNGVAALQEDEVRKRIQALGEGVHDQVRQARMARQAPGNLRRHNPSFEGRVAELRELRGQLAGGAVGVVTALHGLGGMGKTELALTYAHMYAYAYQGGTWQVDCDGQSDMLEAVSSLAQAPELGLPIGASDLADRQVLGRRVLARLTGMTETARAGDEGKGACLVLLDNVSEPGLLSESQLGVLPEESWFHMMVTTRLGVSDVGTAGSRASVALIEIGPLGADDALELIRDHQPARDTARLHSDFSSPEEEAAARRIVAMLDGYTLAVEQAAVYLGLPGTKPSLLLESLRSGGAPMLDRIGASVEGATAIRHQQRVAGAIVDQTLARLPERARDALAHASLLPPDTIPWRWLQYLTQNPNVSAQVTLPGLSGGDDWLATSRVLQGRRLLTPADDARFARLHRVLGEHLRLRVRGPDVEQRLDDLLVWVSKRLRSSAAPDLALLSATAAAVTRRLSDGRNDVAAAGLLLGGQVRERLDLATAFALTGATLAAWESLADAEPANVKQQRGRWIVVDQLGQLHSARGDAVHAMESYERSLHLIERLAGEDPTNDGLQRDLAIALERMGDRLLAQGNPLDAQRSHLRSLAIRERLVAAHPEEADDQASLAISLNKTGGMSAVRGDDDGALRSYRRSLAIAERLAAADPGHPQWQGAVSVSLTNLGDRLAARGDAASAMEHYRQSLKIDEALAAADPTNIGRQSRFATSLRTLGSMLAGRGESQGALDHYSRAADIHEDLAKADPTDTRRKRSLSAVLTDIGGVLTKRGDDAGAMFQYVRALHLMEGLTAIDPSNVGWQRDLSVRLGRISDALARRGDTEDALKHRLRSMDVMEALVAADRSSTEWQRDLSIDFEKVGDELADRGYAQGALELYKQSLTIREQLAAVEPTNTEWQRYVAVGLDRVGTILAITGDAKAALDQYTRAFNIREKLVALDPTNTGWQRELASSLTTLGDAVAGAGDSDAAAGYHARALTLREGLVAADPTNISWRRDLSISHERVGTLLEARGDTAGAIDHFKPAMELRERLAKDDPANDQRQQDLWIIAFKVARTLEAAGDPGAAVYWRKAHDTISALDAAGKLTDNERRFLDHFQAKIRGEEQ